MKKLIIILSMVLFMGGCSQYYITQQFEAVSVPKNTCGVVTYVWSRAGCGANDIVYSEFYKGHAYGRGIPCDTIKEYKKQSYERAEKAIRILEDNDQ